VTLLVVLGIGAGITLLAVVGAIAHAVAVPDAPPAPEPRRERPRAAKAETARAQPMMVEQMATRGFFARTDASGEQEEALPESPLGHGEFPMGVWVAPDHTVFAVGKLYTGRPGPDEGVVWRRAPEGTWSFALRLPTRVIGDVAGRSGTEVVAGTMGGIVCFDGQSWHEHALPYAMMWKVWSDGDELVAQAFDGSVAYTVERGIPAMTTPRTEPRRDRYVFVRDGVTYRIFDRSRPIGQRALDPREEAEIRRELAMVEEMWARGEGGAANPRSTVER
jgi:hypothetical protein